MNMTERQWGKPVDGLAIGIGVDAGRIRAGETLHLRLWTINVAPKPREMLSEAPLASYRVRLRGAEGNELPYSGRGEQLAAAALKLSRAVTELRTGEEHSAMIELDRIFDLQPGRYAVRAEREVFAADARPIGTAVSNEVLFEITQR